MHGECHIQLPGGAGVISLTGYTLRVLECLISPYDRPSVGNDKDPLQGFIGKVCCFGLVTGVALVQGW